MNIPSQITGMRAGAGELGLLLAFWCDQNSGSRNLQGLAAMLDLLKNQFRRLPGTVEHLPLADSPAEALRIRVRPNAPLQLLVSGHFDTAYDLTDPFQRCKFTTDDALRGPGVLDMKGGLVVMHAALEAFERTTHAQRIGYEVLLTPDKEIGSTGSHPLLKRAALRHHLGLIFEPARPNGDLVHSRNGTGNFTVTSFGRPAPATNNLPSSPDAVGMLSDFFAQIRRLSHVIPGLTVTVEPGRSSYGANNVAVFAETKMEIGITEPAHADEVLAKLRGITAGLNAYEGCKLEVSGAFHRPPMPANPGLAPLLSAWQECGAALGQASFASAHSLRSSDANLLASAGLPCLDGLGPVGDLMHSPKEWIRLRSLGERAQVAALFLHRLAAGEISVPPKRAAGAT